MSFRRWSVSGIRTPCCWRVSRTVPSPDPRPLASHRLSTQGLLGARHRRQGDSSASLLPFLAPAVSYPPCRCDLDAVAAMRPNPLAAYSLRNIVLAAWPFPKIRWKRCGQVFKTGRQKRKTAEILQKRRNKQHSAEQVAFRKKRKVLMESGLGVPFNSPKEAGR